MVLASNGIDRKQHNCATIRIPFDLSNSPAEIPWLAIRPAPITLRGDVVTTRPVSFLESAEAQMDDLLWRVCEELQLSPTRYQQAVDRYEAVCRWLEAEGSVVAQYRPSMYAQGSMRIGTTVKPFGHEEHDLDFVCEFNVSTGVFESPLQLLKLVIARLGQNDAYARLLEVKNRCVRLNYANEFHMDILPACPDAANGNSCLVVPDRESRQWKPSNPKGYADWFEERCELVLAVMAESARLLAKAEPIPSQEATWEKATLKRAVQLLKRWRDLRYEHQKELAPISMVLTTLAAQAYRGQLSVSEALTGILNGIVALIASSKPRIYVLNPANPLEDLSERWEDPVQYGAFVTGIRELNRVWTNVLAMGGVHNAAKLLDSLFGEPVKAATSKQARQLESMRERSALRVAPAGLITAAPAIGVAMRANTFHGKK
jgi:hypothetical protein